MLLELQRGAWQVSTATRQQVGSSGVIEPLSVEPADQGRRSTPAGCSLEHVISLHDPSQMMRLQQGSLLTLYELCALRPLCEVLLEGVATSRVRLDRGLVNLDVVDHGGCVHVGHVVV